ncbi:MAG: hypothetical protein K2N21_01700, partial [Rikenellaceae bacterium]|nr:hypothetical protein [Rikenellaceae bacterium]
LFVILTTSGGLFWLCESFTYSGRTKTYNLLQLRNLAIRLGIMTPLTATLYIQKPLFRQNISDSPNRYSTSYSNNYQTKTSNNYNTKTPDYSHYQRKPTPYDKSDD